MYFDPHSKKKYIKKQTILITGAGSGRGKGTAIGLAKIGHKIIAAVHTWEQMSRFIEDLKDTNYEKNAELFKLDMSHPIDCEKLGSTTLIFWSIMPE